MSKKNILICKAVKYHSLCDEDAFFEWLNKIAYITNIKGVDRELHISINGIDQSLDEVCDLYGVFKRYKFKNIDQLKIFMNNENKYLFE